jgi:hypothetical protein
MTTITVILANASNSLQSFTIPSDCQSAQIECYSGGAGGQNGCLGGGGSDRGSGGSGGYTVATGIALTPGTTVYYQVGLGGQGDAAQSSITYGSTGGDGQPTWFNGTSVANSSCSANGARGPNGGGNGSGGSTSGIVGTGTAGKPGQYGNTYGSAGGTSAPGPSISANYGGPASGTSGDVGGGGGAGVGTAGFGVSSASGANGGNGNANSGGTGSFSPTVNGGDATVGDGGGGGGGAGASSGSITSNGGNGTSYYIYTDTYSGFQAGPGGGGGGAGGSGNAGAGTGMPQGGNAGFGAGGGAGGLTGSGGGAGGNGGQGFIVITYISTPPIIVNNSNKFLVKLKHSGVAGHIPSTLAPGEIAINYVDNLIYAANTGNVVSVIAAVVPATANSFSTNSTISLSNAATGSVSFNGSSNVSIATTANFSATNSAQGSFKYPTGIMCCFGSSTLSSGTKNITFATPFPTACISIQATSRGTAVATQLPIFCKTPTTTTATFYANTSSTYAFYYVAFGY